MADSIVKGMGFGSHATELLPMIISPSVTRLRSPPDTPDRVEPQKDRDGNSSGGRQTGGDAISVSGARPLYTDCQAASPTAHALVADDGVRAAPQPQQRHDHVAAVLAQRHSHLLPPHT